MTPTRLPARAYVPGRNERHPEGAFDALRRTAAPCRDAAELARCDAFRAGLRFLDAGYFWEAHEVLEPVWMVLPDGSVERRFVQGLIQLANGRLKLVMGRPKAALRLVGMARALVPPVERAATVMTLEVREVHRRIDALERDASEGR